MKTSDISTYWQTYADLIELWAKGIWDEVDLAAHFDEHGKPEGRRIVDAGDWRQDWSDTLYFSQVHNDFEWWWQKGVLETGLYAALAEGESALEQGCISRNPTLQEKASLSAQSMAQVVENAHENLGLGPMRDIVAGAGFWGESQPIGFLPMQAAVQAAISGKNRYVIVLPWLESGGAELVGSWHYKAAQELGLDPLIVLGDAPNVTKRFAGQGMNILNLPQLYADTIGHTYQHLRIEDRVEILTMALETLAPERMHLIHSYIGYTALTNKDARARIRAACGQVDVSAFCPHIHPNGAYDGYFRYIPALVDIVDTFIFDNTWYQREMAQVYGLDPAKSAALKYPVDGLHPVGFSAKKRKKVLWASRFDSQKNPQIVGEIAAKMPDTDFVMYGRKVMGDVEIDWDTMPDNVSDKGEFFGIDDLPLDESFAFLYTSKFDGTPNILLEVGSRGVPIVTANIGGISDFLGADWPLYVGSPEDVDGYVSHLRALQSSPKTAKKRIDEQNAFLTGDRSFAEFLSAFAQAIGLESG